MKLKSKKIINYLIKFVIQFPWPDSEPLSVGENGLENEPGNNMKQKSLT